VTLILNGTDNSATTPAVTGTDTDTGVYYPAANQVALATNGTLALIVDSSQNVGIGTASPTNYANQRTLAVNGTTYGRIDLMAGGTVYGSLYGGTGGPTLSTGSALPVMFETSGTERMRINAGAPILCLSGGSTTATGTGIAFPATQSASSNANTLDDYEEGTYTITLTPASSGSITLVSGLSTGSYIKIGRQVFVTAYFQIQSVSSPVGVLNISIPFAATASGDSRSVASLGFNAIGGSSLNAAWGIVETSSTSIAVYNGSGTAVVANYAQQMIANTDCRFFVSYQTAS